MDPETIRVPVPQREWFSRHGWQQEVPPPNRALQQVQIAPRILEDFQPTGAHLEWRLSEHYWTTRGVLAFQENLVPYVINNSGLLSEQVARVLYAACEAAPPTERLIVAELGAGSGLFARLFLGSFQMLCAQEGRDYYERLTYLATDSSALVVNQWQDRDVFAEHSAHVQTCAMRATDPFPAGVRPRLVVCNYLLDVLPAAILRRAPDGSIEQLHVRTHLSQDAPASLSVAVLHGLALFDSPEAREGLLRSSSYFDLEVEFLKLDEPPSDIREACADSADLERVLYNHEALACLASALTALEPEGFVIVNDYGPTQRDGASQHTNYQTFGSTTAFGVNFPLLERRLVELGASVIKPSGDAQSSLHSRLISAKPLPQVAAGFESAFGEASCAELARLSALVRGHAQAGRTNLALEGYRAWLDRNPRDWALLGEVSEFMITQVRDYAAALTLARSALQLNPAYSTWLWNLLGDALYCLERFGEAHDAYLQAERIHPREPRTNYNLARTYLRRGELDTALRVIARGLLADGDGAYRDRLLANQRDVLAAASSVASAESQRRLLRIKRLQEP